MTLPFLQSFFVENILYTVCWAAFSFVCQHINEPLRCQRYAWACMLRSKKEENPLNPALNLAVLSLTLNLYSPLHTTPHSNVFISLFILFQSLSVSLVLHKCQLPYLKAFCSDLRGSWSVHIINLSPLWLCCWYSSPILYFVCFFVYRGLWTGAKERHSGIITRFNRNEVWITTGPTSAMSFSFLFGPVGPFLT